MTKKLYKFLRTGLKSQNGNHKWEIGKWYKTKRELDICHIGFHASKTPLQAMEYVQGEVLAKVEVKGRSIKEDDKECWSDMRIVKAWNWEKKDSVSLSIFAAEKVLKNYEKAYPDDDRPRKAIEAAKKVLKADTEENRKMAARSAAWSAARSAESAARRAARSAAWSTESAERSARKKLITSLDRWFLKRIKTLTEIK